VERVFRTRWQIDAALPRDICAFGDPSAIIFENPAFAASASAE
jgi:hypothetical protein